MKKIRKTGIDPNKLITKANYAKKIGVSQTTIQNWVKEGKLCVVIANGCELIHE